jgi:hypothetical protein
MSSDKLRTCVVCGNKYKYCRSCSEYAHLEPWHYAYDKDECRKIFHICSEFGGNSYSADVAKQKLEEIGLPKTLTNSIRESVDRIYNLASSITSNINYNKDKIEETSEPTEVQPTPIAEELKTEEVSEESKSEEIPSVIKGFRKRRLERQKKNEEN